MSKPVLLQNGPLMKLTERLLAEGFAVQKLHEAADREAFLKKVAPEVVAIATGGHTGVKTDGAYMARFPKLKVVTNFGVGYDSVDAAAAAQRGVVVCNTPDVLNEEVADTTLGLLLNTVREFSKAEGYLRAGQWSKSGDYPLTASLRNRKVGIVGLGRIGKAIAKRCEAFGMPVSYFGRNRQSDVSYAYFGNLVEMAKAVDTMIVITPGGPATKNLINADVLAALGANGIFVNVSRGSVVDEAALMAALKNKTILAAGLDVFASEPNFNQELLALPNLTMFPHVGSGSVATRDAMGTLCADNALALVKGIAPRATVSETPFKGW